MNLNLVKRLAIGSIAGVAISYLIVHPFFIFTEHYLVHRYYTALQSILMAFSGEHFKTAITIIILGLIIGFTMGLYSNRVNFFYKKSQQLSITDELTQVHNRRYFISELEKEIERSKRFSLNLSLIILDIDKFKNINDTHGHIMGDQVIQLIAKLLTMNVRKIDFVARYGGDEFVIFMPETDNTAAYILAERLQNKLSQYSFESYEPSIKNTISIGIANIPNDAKNIDELMSNADIALYRAKKGGGGRICNFTT